MRTAAQALREGNNIRRQRQLVASSAILEKRLPKDVLKALEMIDSWITRALPATWMYVNFQGLTSAEASEAQLISILRDLGYTVVDQGTQKAIVWSNE